jgi:hypothetical protein
MIGKHHFFWRIAIPLLMLGSLTGPWLIEDDGVPPSEWCDDPHILLADDAGGTCVQLVTGTMLYSWFLPALPFLGALFRFTDSQSTRVFSYAMWEAAAIPALWTAILVLLEVAANNLELPPLKLWGLWFYIGLAATGLGLDIFIGRRGADPAWRS